jgi:hypothetical protein
MVIANAVAAVLYALTGALLASSRYASDPTIVAAIITAFGGFVASVVSAFVARGIRSDLGLNRDQLERLRDLVKAPRRIGATAGQDDPVVLPPDTHREGDDDGR